MTFLSGYISNKITLSLFYNQFIYSIFGIKLIPLVILNRVIRRYYTVCQLICSNIFGDKTRKKGNPNFLLQIYKKSSELAKIAELEINLIFIFNKLKYREKI